MKPKVVLLTLLLLPLFTKRIVDPTIHYEPPRPPASFTAPIDRDRPAADDRTRLGLVLLPLDDEGTLRMTSAADGVRFDLDGDGTPEQVAWPEAGAPVAFLALDVDGDGRITSRKELIAGFAALARALVVTGASPAGSIHDGDPLYDRLLLWTDANHDGRSQPAELQQARDRFTAIGLGYQGVRWIDGHGNRVRFLGWAHKRTGGPEQGEVRSAAENAERTRRAYEVEAQISGK